MSLFKKILVSFLLISIVIASQIILLKPHLEYGFGDVDWTFLTRYKTQNPYNISQFIKNIKKGGAEGGVYTHQIYYIGMQGDLFGLNFKSFQVTTHIFKILAIILSFPIFFALSGSSLVAFVATILFAFSYSSVGTMYTVVTSSDYSALLSMGLFTLLYWYIIKKNIGNWFWLLITLILFVLTLFLSTERMYPLPLFIVLTELFLLWTKKSRLQKNTLKRITILLLPMVLIFLAQPLIFLDFILRNGVELLQRIIAGNWNLLLTPFVSLGSIILPSSYTEFTGLVKKDNIFVFLDFLITGPLLSLIPLTILIGIGAFKRPHIFILKTLFLTGILSIFLYILSIHFVDHIIAKKSLEQALIGMYILSIAFVSFRYWQVEKDRILIGLFAGPFFAFLYILLTWVGAATSEVFVGAHRYLTIPSMGISLFISTLVMVSLKRLFYLFRDAKFFKAVSIMPFIFLVPFIGMNIKGIHDFFDYQLSNGFGAYDQQFMQSQLNSYLSQLSDTEPSLFYFDFRDDNANSYYYDNTIRGAFPIWMLWNQRLNFNEKLTPLYIWNQPQILPSLVTVKEGKKVFLYDKKFFALENFYAFRLKDRRVIDIKNEVLKQLGI